MPSHRRRSPGIRYTVLATCALGVLGAGVAGIASAKSGPDERDARPVALASDSAPGSPADRSEQPSGADAVAVPASAQPTRGRRPRPTATVRPSSIPTSKPAATATTKPAPTATTTKPAAPAPTATGGDAVLAEVTRLVNVERQQAGCGPLTVDLRLQAAAQKHSELQAAQNQMSHLLPGEASMGDRVTAQGYRWGGVAENVAAGYPTPASVMNGWMNSPGHKANILNCGYRNIGVGVAKSGGGTLYWTQNFASPL